MTKLTDYVKTANAAGVLGVAPNTLGQWGRDGMLTEHRHPMNNYRLCKKSELARLLRLTEKSRA